MISKLGDFIMARIVIQIDKKKEKIAKLSYTVRDPLIDKPQHLSCQLFCENNTPDSSELKL